ncbi:hypothetical protein A6R68_09920, partial [Neotoma lepida]
MTPKNIHLNFTLSFAIKDIQRNALILLNISMLVNIQYNLIAHWMYAEAHGLQEMVLQQVDSWSNNAEKGLEFVSWKKMSFPLN